MSYQSGYSGLMLALFTLLALGGCEGQDLDTSQDADSSPVAESSESGQRQESQSTTVPAQETRNTASSSEWVEPEAVPEPSCANCGTITTMEPAMAKGEGSGIGIVAGGVVGGIVGNQIGGGTGKKIATVAGAVGGAVAGHEVEKYVKSEKYYAVTVKMDNGSTQTVKIANGESLAVGQRVKVDGNNLYLQ